MKHCTILAALIAIPLLGLPSIAQDADSEQKPVFEERTVRVEVKSAYKRIQVIPAKFEWQEEKILIKEASPTTKAEYDTIRVRRQVVPPTVREIEVPAEFRDVTVRSLAKKAAGAKPDKVAEPKFEIRESRVMVSPPSTRIEVTPPKFKTVVKQIMVQEPTDTTPAKYKTYTVQELVAPGTTKTVKIPAEYKTVHQKVLVK